MGSFVSLVTEGMRRKKISLRKIAKGAGLDPSFFSKVLMGKRTPPTDEKVLRKLSQALDLDPLLLIISTGMIPADLQGLFESPDFLKSVRRGTGQEFSRPVQEEARPSVSQVRKKDREPLRVVPKSVELSEDLL